MDSVVRLSRFDASYPFLDHLSVVAASRDLSAMRAAMANLLHEEKLGAASPPLSVAGAAEARERRWKAMAILGRGLGR